MTYINLKEMINFSPMGIAFL